jgi:hypothetical protein
MLIWGNVSAFAKKISPIKKHNKIQFLTNIFISHLLRLSGLGKKVKKLFFMLHN